MENNMTDAILTMCLKNMNKMIDDAYKNVAPSEGILEEGHYNTACDLFENMMYAMHDYADYIAQCKNWGV